MSLQPSLMKAILSMDAYNRGYDAGINTLPSNINDQIGYATITTTSTIALGTGNDADIGFYALAYDYNGETVIAYRGTDYPRIGDTIPKDITNGWALGAGNRNSAQGKMALQFYQEVAKADNGGFEIDPRLANISLTGHSLGGGLSGYVASLYGKEAEVFDSMSYEDAVDSTHFYASIDPQDPQYTTIAQPIIDLVYQGNSPWAPDYGRVGANHIKGESLQFYDPYTDQIFKMNIAAGSSQEWDLGNNVVGLNNVDRHSMSTYVIRQFAEVGGENGAALTTEWRDAAQYFWPVMYDDDFSRDIGMNNPDLDGELQRQEQFSDILRMIIAYSAIDEGKRPFGDTAIRALYDDANEYGRAIAVINKRNGDFDPLLKYAEEISQSFVQFSGQLALSKVLHDPKSEINLTKGMINYHEEPDNQALVLNFTDSLWNSAAGGEMPHSSLGLDALGGSILANTGREVLIRDLMQTTYGDSRSNIFENIVLAVNGEQMVKLPEIETLGKVNLAAGSQWMDTFLMADGNSLVIGDSPLFVGIYNPRNFADYSNVSTGIKVTFTQPWQVQTEKLLSGSTDLLFDVARFRGSQYDDSFDVRNAEFTLIQESLGGNDYVISNQDTQLFLENDTSHASFNNVVLTNITETDYTNLYLANTRDDLVLHGTDTFDYGGFRPIIIFENHTIERIGFSEPNNNTAYKNLILTSQSDVLVDAANDLIFQTDGTAPADIVKQIDIRLVDKNLFNAGTTENGPVRLDRIHTATDQNPYIASADDMQDVMFDTLDDYVYGNAANNVIEGSRGDDWIFGGDGHDILDYSSYSGGIEFEVHGSSTTQAHFSILKSSHPSWDHVFDVEEIRGTSAYDELSINRLDLFGLKEIKISGGDGGDYYAVFDNYDNLTIIEEPHHGGQDLMRAMPLWGYSAEQLTGIATSDGVELSNANGQLLFTVPHNIELLDTGFGVLNISEYIDSSIIITNNAPVAANDDFTGSEDAVITGNVLIDNGNGADSDVEGDPLNVVAATMATATGASVELLGNGDFTYTPQPDYFGPDSFTYTVKDGQGGTSTGTVNITLNAVNDAPIAADDSFTAEQDIAVSGNVLIDNGHGIDSDPEGDPLSVTAGTFTTAQGGQVDILANGDFTYTPTIGFFGIDTFTYSLEDGQGGSDVATVDFTVTEKQAPTLPGGEISISLEPVSVTALADSAAINLSTFSAKTHSMAFETSSDVTTTQMLFEQGGTIRGLNMFIENGALYAAVWNKAEENWGYKELSSFIGANTKYTATLVMDSAYPADGTLSLTLNGVEVGTLSGIGLLYNHGGDIGVGQINDNTLLHDQSATSTSSFTGYLKSMVQYNQALTGTDLAQLDEYMGHEWLSGPVPNLAPVAIDDLFVGEVDTQLSGNVLADNGNGSDSDPENDPLSVTAGTFTTAQGGSVVVQNNGDFTYTPAGGFTGDDSFVYTLLDGNGGSDQASVNLAIASAVPSLPAGNLAFSLDPVTISGLADDALINLNTFPAKTHAIAFETGSDVTTTQVVYEQGGATRGLNMFIENGALYAAVWNKAEENWGYKELSSSVEANTKYTASLVMDGSLPANGTAIFYLNGTEIESVSGVGHLYAHGDDTGIGQINGSTLLHDLRVDGGTSFFGNIEKIVQYNEALSGEDLIGLQGYMAHEWLTASDPAPDPAPDPVEQVVMEFGTVEADHNAVSVDLVHDFTNPVVFMTMTTFNGGQMAAPRINDIQNGSFTFFAQEPEYLDGAHALESFSYLVVEKGTWTLSDGTLLEAGTLSSNKQTTDGWESVNFASDFATRPAVLSQVQTYNESDFVVTRQDNATKDGLDLAMQEQESQLYDIHADELLGWLAIETGAGSDDGFDFFAESLGNQFTHNWQDIVFDDVIDQLPQLIATISSTDGGDTSAARVQNLNTNGAQVMVQEDQSNDSETNHTTETFDIFAIEGAGQLTGVQTEII